MTKSGLLAVFAHPDDESFRPGGTLARLARLGVRVWVLCATRGEAGVPGLDPAQTGRMREAELQCACLALGIEPPRFLDYQDRVSPRFARKCPLSETGRYPIFRELLPAMRDR
jgi:LmbE family N-acetylglucosaminyl deacetylase